MAERSRIELDRRSTPEQIARGLSRLVLSGELLPGRPVRESVVAARLGVSRNTVREAVRILERTGLVRYEMNRGAIVREPSQEDLHDVYQARLAIEVGAAHISDKDEPAVGTVTAALDRLRGALESGDPDAAIAADLEFHATLVGLAHSTRLDAAFEPVLTELRHYLAILSAHDEYADVDRINAEHVAIAEAFGSGDGQVLAAAVTQHIHENASRVSAILTASGH